MAAATGGFPVVVYVNQKLLQSLLDLYHRSWLDEFHRGFSYENGGLKLAGAISADAPQLRLEGRRPRTTVASVDLTAHLRVRLEREGSRLGFALFSIAASLDVPIEAANKPWLSMTISLERLSVQSLVISVVESDPAAQAEAARISVDAAFLEAITDELRRLAKGKLKVEVPTRAFSDLKTQAIEARLFLLDLEPGPLVVLDHHIAVCGTTADFKGSVEDVRVPLETFRRQHRASLEFAGRTPGSIGQLPLLAAIDSRFAVEELKFALDLQVRIELPKATLSDRTIEFGRGRADIHLYGHHDQPAPFSGRAEFWVDAALTVVGDDVHLPEAHVKVDLHEFASTLNNILFDEFARSTRHAVMATLSSSVMKTNGAIPDLTWAGTLPFLNPADRSTFVAELVGVGFGEEVIVAAARAAVKPYALGALGDTSLKIFASHRTPAGSFTRGDEAFEHLPIRQQHWEVEYTPALDDRFDVEARCSVAVLRGSDGALVATSEVAWADEKAARLQIDIWRPELYLERELILKAMVWRPLDGSVQGVRHTASEETRRIAVHDLFDRSAPYVRFKHRRNWKAQDGSVHSEERASAVHKTAPAERCRFADSGSSHFHFDYLPALPAPASPGFRTDLCDYCFYGGPDKAPK